MNEIPNVKLIWITPRAEQLLTYMARVSNPSATKETYNGYLLHYLIKHQHWSPFEMVHACIEINTTRDIARQILRHRSFSFQEFSQRYADPARLSTSIIPLREARLQDRKNRQNSIPTKKKTLKLWWEKEQQEVAVRAKATYQQAVERGIAKEQARVVLPEGLTPSRLYMAGNMRSWIHYLALRRGHGTQKEHQEVAEKCYKVLKPKFPNLFDSFQSG